MRIPAGWAHRSRPQGFGGGIGGRIAGRIVGSARPPPAPAPARRRAGRSERDPVLLVGGRRRGAWLVGRSTPAGSCDPPSSRAVPSAGWSDRVDRTSHTATAIITTPSATNSATSTATVVPVDATSVARGCPVTPSTAADHRRSASLPTLPTALRCGTLAIGMTDLLWTLGAIVVCAGMFFIASRMEPHWVAKDGTRFITTSQLIDRFGQTIGRRREVRVAAPPRRRPDGVATLDHQDDQRRLADPGQVAEPTEGSPGLPPQGDPAGSRRRAPRLARPCLIEDRAEPSTPSRPTSIPTTRVWSAFRHLIQELGDGVGELIDIDQERVVAVR